MTNPINEEDGKWYKSKSGIFLPQASRSGGDLVKTKQTFLNKEISWLIDNLTVVLLLPSLLGAIWQLFELSRIHISYIRFFSLSQIPVDGALILSLVFIFYVMGKLIKSFVVGTSKAKMERYSQPEILAEITGILDKTIKNNIVTLVILIVLEVGIFAYFIVTMFPSSPIVTIFMLSFFTLGTIVIAAEIVILYGVKLYNNDENAESVERSVRKALESHWKHIGWVIIISLAIGVVFIFLLLKSFSENFVLPISLYNIENMEDVIYSEFKTTDYDIEYMNDQYIFVSLCTIKSCDHELDKKIVIYPTEKVLFE